MKGFKFISYLTYTFQKSPNEMNQILQQDGYQTFNIKQDQNLIIYEINNQRVIRLDNLLYLYSINYVKLTIAQLIQLCLVIVQKYQQMQSNSIKHNYLHQNRILLNLHEECQSISIRPQFLYYTIHFTGYDCPFYEKQDHEYKIKDEDAIKSILNKIIECIELKLDKKQKIFEDIKKLKSYIAISFNLFIQQIENIFIQYSNKNNQYQILYNIDTQFSDLNIKRNNREQNVQKNLKKLIKIYQYDKNQNWYVYEYFLYQTIPLITKEFRKGIYYSEQILPQDNKIFNFQQQMKDYDLKIIDDLINENINRASQYLKFDWEINLIKEDIQMILNQEFDQLQYFLNDINFIKQEKNLKIQINEFKMSIIKKVSNETFQMYLEYRYLQLINDLI